MKWKIQPQDQKATYHLSGRFLITKGIQSLLTDEEISAIYLEVQKLVKENKGIDYLVVYMHEDTQQKLFFIDQLNKEMIESNKFKESDNVCTLLLAEEYWSEQVSNFLTCFFHYRIKFLEW